MSTNMVLKLARCDNQTFFRWNMGVNSSETIFPIVTKGTVCWRDLEKWFLAHIEECRELVLGKSVRMMTCKVSVICGCFVKREMSTEVAIPLLSMVLQFMREPCLSIEKELQFTALECTDVRLQIR
jgi:hypothetical protein